MAWTDRYVTVAGAGAHDGLAEGSAFTLAEAIADAATPHPGYRYNVKAGTYALTAATTFSGSGTTTAPIWWRGYASVIGDLDTGVHARVPGTDTPLITGDADAQIIISGSYQFFSFIAVSSVCVSAGGSVATTGSHLTWLRCRFINTQAGNAAARAFTVTSGYTNHFIACSFAADAAAQIMNLGGISIVFGCSFRGGLNGITAAARIYVFHCNFHNPATTAINPSGNECIALNNNVYGAGTDGVLMTSAPSTGTFIANNIFSQCGGYGINQSGAADTYIIRLFSNDFYLNTSNPINGFTEQADDLTGDMNISLLHKAEVASPWVDVDDTHFDFALAAAAVAKSAAFPGAFENETYIGYPDIGAVRHVDPAGGGGAINLDKMGAL